MSAPRPPFPGLLAGTVVLAIAFALQLTSGLALAAFRVTLEDLSLWTVGALSLTTLGIAIAVASVWGSRVSPGFSPWITAYDRPPANPTLLSVGIVATSVGASIAMGEVSNRLMEWIPPSSELVRFFDKLLEPNDFAASLFALSLVAPLTEELLFRGVLLPGFARRYGIAAAIVMTSALFALFHLNVWQAVPAFFVGIYLGWLRLSTRTIFPAVAAHAAFNASPLVSLSAGWTIAGYNSPISSGIVSIDSTAFGVGIGLFALGIAASIGALWGRTSCPHDRVSAKMPE